MYQKIGFLNILRKAWPFVLLIVVIVTAMDIFIIQALSRRMTDQQKFRLQTKTATIRAQIESFVNTNMTLIYAAAANISLHPNINSDEFYRFARQILTYPNQIKNLTAAPDNRIVFVYPQKGNEKIIGLDYRKLKDQWLEVKKAIETDKMIVAGPLDLVQGGKGLVGRIPVYIKRNGKKEYWGLVSSVIDFNAKMQILQKQARSFNLSFALRGKDGKGSQGDIFYGDKSLFFDNQSIQMGIRLPNGFWQIAARPLAGWQKSHPFRYAVHLIMATAGLLLIFFTFSKMKKDMYLQMSEQRFKDLVYSSSDWVWEVNANGQYIYASGNVEKILGYKPENLLGKSPFDTMSPQEAQRVGKIFTDKATQKMPIQNLENQALNKNGDIVYLLTNGVPVLDMNGDLLGYRGVDKDITVKKQKEQELKKNKTLLDLFFSQSMIGFFFMMLDEPVFWDDNVDKDKVMDYVFSHQRITKVNQSILKQYHAKEEQFLGLTPNDFFAHDIENGKALWKEFFDNGHLHIDTQEKRFDDSNVMIEGDYICIFDEQGRIAGHFGVQKDVTKDREAEKQLERYIEIVDKNVITSQTDIHGYIIYASEAFCNISEFSKPDLLGKNHNVVRHPDMPAQLFKEMWQTIENNEVWHGELKNKKNNGGYYWVDTYISPLFNMAGEKTGYMAVRQDITDKKEIERISITDRLTGIFNRMRLDEVLIQEQNRYERYGQVYSIILFDIDFFKKVNDTYGHIAGDSVLKETAALIKKQVRVNDVFGRWGGEEFLLICPQTGGKDAHILAEKLRKSLAEYGFSQVPSITASFGVACIKNAANYNELLMNADKALYQAKDQGRNRVCVE